MSITVTITAPNMEALKTEIKSFLGDSESSSFVVRPTELAELLVKPNELLSRYETPVAEAAGAVNLPEPTAKLTKRPSNKLKIEGALTAKTEEVKVEEVKITTDQLRAALQKVVEKKGIDSIGDVMGKFKKADGSTVDRISTLQEKDFAAFIKECESV